MLKKDGGSLALNSIDSIQEGAIAISYTLSRMDIFRLILRIHGILLILPLAFLISLIATKISGYYLSIELHFYFILFVLGLLAVFYVYISHYFIFKKLLFYRDADRVYNASIHPNGVTISQDKDCNHTEYTWRDFIKCRETKTRLYLFFKYDRAIIIKKNNLLPLELINVREILRKNFKKGVKRQ